MKIAAILTCVGGAFGCAPAQSKIQRDLEVMQRESRPDQLTMRGESFAAVGDMTRAEQYFLAALHAGGDAGSLVRRLVAVCVADGRYPAALEYAEDHLRKHPHDLDVRYVVATLRMATGDAKSARENLQVVLAAKPEFGEAHFTLAQLEKEQGDIMAADAQYREYLRLSPDGAHAEVARAGLMRSVQ